MVQLAPLLQLRLRLPLQTNLLWLCSLLCYELTPCLLSGSSFPEVAVKSTGICSLAQLVDLVLGLRLSCEECFCFVWSGPRCAWSLNDAQNSGQSGGCYHDDRSDERCGAQSWNTGWWLECGPPS